MRRTSKSPSKKVKLEPLSVADALASPTVEGMFSFLSIRPEELLQSRELAQVVLKAAPRPDNRLLVKEVREEDRAITVPGPVFNSDPAPEINTVPGPELIEASTTAKIDTSPGPEYITRPGPYINTRPGIESDADPGQQQQTVSGETVPGLGFNQEDGTLAENAPLTPDAASPNTLALAPGVDAPAERSLVVSQVRYTMRRAKSVQDGHTSNEQRLYEYLWIHGDPYDDVSRRVSIGFRTLAEKIRMARASAQKNVRALVQKLAIEVIEDFDVTSSRAPTYRVFNDAEILRRREIAGMTWYVRRTQAVRFVDRHGREIGGPLISSPGLAFAPSPGLIFDRSPGPNPVPGLELRLDNRETAKSGQT